jgi:hypothetical protein
MSKTRQGMPGYIKTAQDKSSSGLANPSKARGGQLNPVTSGGKTSTIPMRKGEPRKNWQAATSTGGSQDVSYYKTSTDKPGTIRKGGEPKAPAKRSMSEMETTPGGTTGKRNAMAGVTSANKLPAGGISADKTGANHITGSGHRGLGSANARGTKGMMAQRNSGSGRGTMESLRGKMKMGKKSMY